MTVKVTDVAAGVLALCALVLTAVVVRRETTSARSDLAGATRAVPYAAQLALAGRAIGADSAELTVVEFADFQCEYCAEQARILSEFRAAPGHRIRVIFRHLPLVGLHPLAWPAALAAECAASQGRFEQFHDRLFSLQDSLGMLSWDNVAARAGVPDIGSFSHCVQRQEGADAVERDLGVARLLELRATPSLLVGDSLYEGVVTRDALQRLLRVAASHKRRL